MRFLMIGVIHRDKEGPSLLKKWLLRVKPSVITVEISKYGLDFRKKYGPYYKKKIEEFFNAKKEKTIHYPVEIFRDLISYFDIPYEYRVPEAYVKKYGGMVYPIDMDLFSYRNLKKIARTIEKGSIESFLMDGYLYDKRKERWKAFLYFERGIKTFEYTKEMHLRDRFMAKRIKSLMEEFPSETFVHICGWQHLSDPLGVFQVFNPEKVFLHDRTHSF